MGFDSIHGSVRLAADGVVGISGKPTRVYNATFIVSNTTANNLVLRNGSSASGAVYVQHPGTNGKSVTVNWKQGLLFPDGCFFDKDTNTDSVVLEFRGEV